MFVLLKTLCGGSSKIWAGLQNGTTTELAKQTEVNSLKSSVSSGKAQIASAITGKGVSTSSSASFSTMATNIGKIQTSSTFSTGNFSYVTVDPENGTSFKGATFIYIAPATNNAWHYFCLIKVRYIFIIDYNRLTIESIKITKDVYSYGIVFTLNFITETITENYDTAVRVIFD